MLSPLMYVAAGESLMLKAQSHVAIITFGAIFGVLLRQVFGAIEQQGFFETDTAKRAPWDPS